MLAALQAHPHAAAVLGAALLEDAAPSHAYLLAGPAGAGKRSAARQFAAELLAQGAPDPDSVRTRVEHGTHPDLTWVAPSGAHEMLRRDVDEAVVSAAGHTPFEARFRVFVLERTETLNDEAANALLKTLEEPPAYVVLLMLTDRPGQVMATIASRCQVVRFDALSPRALAERLTTQGLAAETARACGSLALGDAERALTLAFGEGPRIRADAEAYARAPLHGKARERPWREVLAHARGIGQAARSDVEGRLADELEFLPRKEHRRREIEFADRARRAERRAETQAIDHSLQLAGLWYRDLACMVAGAPELVHNADRAAELTADASERDSHELHQAVAMVEETRARLALNVSYELACEALAYRLETLLTR